MAASVVAICNMALDMLAAKPIASLTDGSTTANLCQRNYEPARDETLRSYPWNDAMARVSLAASATAPAWGPTYAYPLPADCLRVVVTEDDALYGVAWRVEGREIVCDEAGPLNIRYIRQLTDPSLIGPLLARVIAARLAAAIAYGLTGDARVTQGMSQAAEVAMRDARRMDALEQSSDDSLIADTWTGARYLPYGI
ncbi:MAG: hypothetical protein IT555_10985 [Acetobacteraceae bacterium]|nr:hypothetical protein [Acetobacteraceae bacterium]